MVSRYVRIIHSRKTREGTITDSKIENGHVEYLFHHDPRLENVLPDFWVMESEIEVCLRPTDSEVKAINALAQCGWV
jgi:hypothetical protein